MGSPITRGVLVLHEIVHYHQREEHYIIEDNRVVFGIYINDILELIFYYYYR